MKITYFPVAANGWNPALELLFQNVPELLRVHQIEEWMRKSLEGEFDLSGLVGAYHENRLIGVIFFLVQPDRSALVWSPQCVPKTENAVSDGLIQFVNQHLDESGVTLSQCLLELRETDEIRRMTSFGYRYLADLVYMECDVAHAEVAHGEVAHGEVAPSSKLLKQIPYDEQKNHARFVDVLQKTYRDTLDCPAIQGLRTPEETLLSHRSSGEFHPGRWNIYAEVSMDSELNDGESNDNESNDCGLILLADHPEQNAWELVYMGIVPEARGKGLGLTMVRDALKRTKEFGRNSMIVAVDQANVYAIKVYKKAGFHDIAVRRVLMRNVQRMT